MGVGMLANKDEAMDVEKYVDERKDHMKDKSV